MHKLLLKWSYFATHSQGYQSWKQRLRQLIIEPHSRQRKWFDSLMILLVLLSVSLMIVQVRYPLGDWVYRFELVVIVTFIFEYLLRFWLHSDLHQQVNLAIENAQRANVPINWPAIYRQIAAEKWRYVTSPLAIIDLLAIIPVYRPLRFLRVFLLFRLFKLLRYSRTIAEFSKVLSEKRFELHTLLLFVAIIIVISGAALYVFEAGRPNSHVNSLFDAFYWSLVTISTVGYGDITPISVEGRVVTMVLIISGVGVVAFFTSTLVSAFSAKLPEIQENRILAEIEKCHSFIVLCGYGRIGQIVANKLLEMHKKIVVIDQLPENVNRARLDGFLAIQADASEAAVLNQLNLSQKGEYLVCVTDDDVTNLYITLSARQLDAELPIIARVNEPENKTKMCIAGATKVISPSEITAGVSREFAGQPVAFEAVVDILSGAEGVGMETITVTKNGKLLGRKLCDVDLTEFNLVLIGVLSGKAQSGKNSYPVGSHHFLFNPNKGYLLQEDDRLVVVGHYQSASYFMEYSC